MAYVKTTLPVLGRKPAAIRNRRLKSVGVPAFVDPEPVRRHLVKLVGFGMTPMMISRNCGVCAPTVANTLNGVYERLSIHTASLMMKAHPLPREGMPFVLSVGAVRRVQALRALGWSNADLEQQSGVRCKDVHQRASCLYTKWLAISRVYDQLCMTPGPSDRTRMLARKRGYPNPLEWEGLDIDDPGARAVLAVELSAEFLAQGRAELKQDVIDAYGSGLCAE